MGDGLLQTAVAFNKACQIVLDHGLEKRTYNKNVLNRDTYNTVRNAVPNLSSALVQTARDQASEMLKRGGFRKIEKKRLSVRYDKRTFKFYPESNRVSLTTVFGRLSFPFKHYAYMDRWKGEYTNAQLFIRGGKALFNVQVKIPDPPHTEGSETLGIDRGITNIAVCSDNTFYNSKHLRAVKGRYQHNRQALQSVDTRSAKRHLKRLSGRERRFVRSVNHILSKAVVAKPYDIIALEKLGITKSKKNGKRFNRKLGSWSFHELQTFIEYKAMELGKTVVLVNPRHTSQACSRCGYVNRGNRQGSKFKCLNCGFELNADLDASRNIGVIGRSEYLRLKDVNQPIVAPSGSYKPTPSGVGS